MSEHKHTPGEWFARKDEGWKGWSVADDAHTLIATVSDDDEHLHDNEQDEANARLIAAAPDMLEALESFNHLVPELWGDMVVDGQMTLIVDEDTIDAIKAAIKKARGE